MGKVVHVHIFNRENLLVFTSNSIEHWNIKVPQLIRQITHEFNILKICPMRITQIEENFILKMSDANDYLSSLYQKAGGLVEGDFVYQKYIMLSQNKLILMNLCTKNFSPINFTLTEKNIEGVKQVAYFDDTIILICQSIIGKKKYSHIKAVSPSLGLICQNAVSEFSKEEEVVQCIATDNINRFVYLAIGEQVLQLTFEQKFSHYADFKITHSHKNDESRFIEKQRQVLRIKPTICSLYPFYGCNTMQKMMAVGSTDASVRVYLVSTWEMVFYFGEETAYEYFPQQINMVVIMQENQNVLCCASSQGQISYIWLDSAYIINEHRIFNDDEEERTMSVLDHMVCIVSGSQFSCSEFKSMFQTIDTQNGQRF